MKLTASLWIHLARCYSMALREVRTIESAHGLTLPQFDILAQLLRRPEGMTAGELSSALLVTAGNVTGILARLQQRKLVTRSSLKHDHRVAVIRLTPRGARVARSETARHVRSLVPIFSRFPRSEQRRLRESLLRLARILEERRANGCR